MVKNINEIVTYKIELKNKRKIVKSIYDELYEENLKEINRQMQITQTKLWKNKNPDKVSLQSKRRYMYLKETERLRNILCLDI